MSTGPVSAYRRLYRGETSFDFAGRWRRWLAISGIVIVIGMVSVGVRGLNFSIEFKGGTQWTVATTASVSDARNAVGSVNGSLRQATITQLTNRQSGQREIEVQAAAKDTANNAEVSQVSQALAKMAHVSVNEVTLNDVGPSWGSDITSKAVKAVIIFLIAFTIYIWLRFEGKMALAALIALLHDILVTIGIYSLSGFQVSPDTVVAFLTILGYSLYDTIVVFDKIEENTKGLASTGRITYTDTVNLSMNQVLARSLNTSLVAILPILSILVIGSWILGASALNDFGLALFVGLATGAYSSLFIASPVLAVLKEREPRYAQIRRRLQARPAASRPLTPATVAGGGGGGGRPVAVAAGASGGPGDARSPARAASASGARSEPPKSPATAAPRGRAVPRKRTRPARPAASDQPVADDAPQPTETASAGHPDGAEGDARSTNGATDGAAPEPAERPPPARPANRPAPRPRKKRRR